MRPFATTLLCAALGVTLLAVPAWGQARDLALRDGSALKGEIVDVDIATGIRLDIGEGIEVQLPWEYLDPVKAKPIRRKLITSDLDADELFAFGQWCQQFDLVADAEEIFRDIVDRVDVHHAPSRRELGHVRYRNRWMPVAERDADVRRRAAAAESPPGDDEPEPEDRPTPTPEPGEAPDRAGPVKIVLAVEQAVGTDAVIEKRGYAPSTSFAESLAAYLEEYGFEIVQSGGDFTISGVAELVVKNHPTFFEETITCTYGARISLTIAPTADRLNPTLRAGTASAQRPTVVKAMDAAIAQLVRSVGPKVVSACR